MGGCSMARTRFYQCAACLAVVSLMGVACNAIFDIHKLPPDDPADASGNDSGVAGSGAYLVEAIVDSKGTVSTMAADGSALYWATTYDVYRWTSGSAPAFIARTDADPIAELGLNGGWIAWMADKGAYALPRSTEDAGVVAMVDGSLVETVNALPGIAVDETSAYFTNRKTLGTIKLGQDAVTACQLTYSPSSPTHDGTNLLFFGEADGGGAALYAGPTGFPCATGEPLVSGLNAPTALEADSNGQFWLEDQSVYERTGAEPTVIVAASDRPKHIALGDGRLFVATDTRILVYETASRQTGEVASNQASPTAIAAAGSTVYWATASDGKIWRAVPK